MCSMDRWDSQGIKFIFGMDAYPKVVQLAESLPETTWKALERLARYEIATEPRRKPQRIKEAIVRFKGYLNKSWWARAWRSSATGLTSAGVAIGWWWCAKTSASRKGRWCCLKTLNTSSTSLTTLITALNRSWRLPMSVATRKT